MLSAVVTQNIDGLHQLAGSRTVHELHGSVRRNHCRACGTAHSVHLIVSGAATGDGVPRCPRCGGMVRPDVVLYGETLDPGVVSAAVAAIRGADVLVIGGTSLAVHPAAGLVTHFRGERLVLINRDPTPYDGAADLVIRQPIGQVLGSAAGASRTSAGRSRPGGRTTRRRDSGRTP